MKSFDHFIITRFNIKNKGWLSDKYGQNVNDQKWLTERYELFMMYCYPSVLKQSCKDFTWLVFFDMNTPLKFKEKNKDINNSLPQFNAIYVEDYSDFENKLPEEIKTRAESEYIITSRFDNDDCYHVDTVKTIQKHFKPQPNTIIDLENGLTLDINKVNRLSRKKGVVSGPFVSYIEKIEEGKIIKTAYNCEHVHWKDRAQFIPVKQGYFWLQIIHNRNVSNQMSIDLISNKSYLKGFPIDRMPKFNLKYYVFVFVLQLGVFEFFRTIKASFK
ncbi:glycosyltransferase [Winogradskyella sp. A3E31]|uniref:glycosyltransferase n=1 Tax=Winogradskyella sp. A3E31 TaxID=3349637 RepID=UPI00398B7E05